MLGALFLGLFCGIVTRVLGIGDTDIFGGVAC
jgi:hypothetical protein